MEKKDRPMPLPRSDKGIPCIGQPIEDAAAVIENNWYTIFEGAGAFVMPRLRKK